MRLGSWTTALIAALGISPICPVAECQAKVPIVKIGDQTVKLEVAATEQEIQRGLMFRQSLPEESGMVFLFHPAHPVRFWMKNCFISLDMLFIKDGKISKIARDCPPCREKDDRNCPLFPAEGMVDASEVVEVSAGWAKRHDVKEGDPVVFELPGMSQAKDAAAKEEAKKEESQKDADKSSDTASGDKSK